MHGTRITNLETKYIVYITGFICRGPKPFNESLKKTVS